ncbi:hypothetical protein BP6252_02854 [Coleophoma cylindrospora]|uniref:Heterokaryon incompatibility domain-containing protein n=1 Tax=Coleophoma cylindrospora TaxID=1849047 RepID=A0A3D8SGJ2_9HELO|nr:hypothetical protein BP6252_02854 [Coleophoma cylindrospora]
MRLIDAHTLELREFFGATIPKYAVLSHTWGDDEVTYQDWADRETAVKKAGYAKILGACHQAQEDSIDYVWVDTNCIDKTSSTELSEAINSMFTWYQNSSRCYVYMADVAIPGTSNTSSSDDRPGGTNVFAQSASLRETFRRSKWFTRGWTLQELLASTHVTFFSDCWRQIGTKQDQQLLESISSITKIKKSYISNSRSLESATISERMSWSANRFTTRIEDMAYCMLGIFDINMPLLYGEGSKAFLRLQEHIIAVSTDQTIFCWSYGIGFPEPWSKVFAPHPSAFRYGASYTSSNLHASEEPFSLTNAGLSMSLPRVSIKNFLHIIFLQVMYDEYHVALILDSTYSRHPYFKHPITLPGTFGVGTSSFLNVRKNFSYNDEFLTDTATLVLMSSWPIYCVETADENIAYRTTPISNHAVISIPARALASVGDVTGVMVKVQYSRISASRRSEVTTDTHCVLAVIRTQHGFVWFSQRVDLFYSRDRKAQLLKAIETLREDPEIPRYKYTHLTKPQFFILPQIFYQDSRITTAFYFSNSDQQVLEGGYYNHWIAEDETDKCCIVL